ncbi:MAG TPA: chemotaxis protein CheW [Allosphingosinicella sp.]
MAELLLIVHLAGRRIALPAAEVEAVVELEGLTRVPGAAPHIAGLSALRSRVLTVIDSRASLGLENRPGEGLTEAIVVPSGGHTYALVVEQIEDVIEADGEPTPVKAPSGPGWTRIAKGMVEAGGDLLMLVDPHALIAGPVALEAA